MVFSSNPSYLDQANWQQQPSHHHQIGSSGGTSAHHLHPPPPPPPPPPPLQPHAGSSGSIRPGSMADRARMANLPMPEMALKCPRCESTNTKFCYFNNYSLTQPRHFCKTCRRYWTRGGALRSVPVGGGCRRNKRTNHKGSGGGGSSSSSKSPAISGGGGGGDRQTSSGTGGPSNSVTSSADHMMAGLVGSQFQPMRFMSPLHNMIDQYGGGGATEIGLNNNYGEINQPQMAAEAATGDINFFLGMDQQWRLPLQTQQFPNLFSGLDQPSGGLFQIEGGGGGGVGSSSYGGGVGPTKATSATNMNINHHHHQQQQQQQASSSVKMEDNQEMNLSRQFLGMGIPRNDNHQYNWMSSSNSPWTDVSGFSSSSTNHQP